MSILQIILIGTAIIAFALWQSVRGGKRFVRAHVFLEELNKGASAEAANEAAARVFARGADKIADANAAIRAQAYAKANTKGKQAPVIEQARGKGFTL
ncbi:hypothetical protein CCR83_00640 [Rhodobacter veldkampii DSM 11550]|uniref:Uncharacterized protein n=1 Tax=Phaeovulum veldkampii DSM 11550 TaxID=1185920 RepID=A0A2T4JH85_9RHOB|nr:hypothetical protein [Phaeovulum veldkampii]MBK5944990.1 hypothetical protein [Phaeovulum veldkampii DSM 11550]PTE17203.1 hypothetical protein C5F46_10515 [Phaeovulum veldkampii DSM 11550]TDQ61461.1 hypothetical protein EV658_104175 [Phaeovulum veldkampii DSM 11550]